jgi:diguanylate cyclase (GGDEF)-like protein
MLAAAKPKILLVDDDRASLAWLRDGLASGNFEYFEAYDGAGALAQVRDQKPDLVLMDVEMPGMGGVEACRIIKANAGAGGFGFLPVILMTARRGDGKVEGLELGADDYLVKPIDLLELGARVRSMLRLKGLQDTLVAKVAELEQAQRELEEKRRDLLTLSRTDSLTGLFNRGYFEERFAFEFSRGIRYASPLVLLMSDLDHFKRINDTQGHPAGDAILRELGRVMRATLRDVDLVARYGGEEFVALLPQTRPDEGKLAAERLRQAVEKTRVEHSGATLMITLSVGVAWYPSRGVEDMETLMRTADDALYRAKKLGRNQVCCQED